MFPFKLTFGTDEIGFDVHATIARDFGAYVASARGITYDNRFIAPRRKTAPRSRIVSIVRDGDILIDGVLRERERVFVMPEEYFVPDGPPAVTMRTRGETFRILCLRLLGDPRSEEERRIPAEHQVSEETKALLAELESTVGDASPAFAVALRKALLALAADGVVPADPAWSDPSFGNEDIEVPRAAMAMYPALSNLHDRPMMVDLLDRAGIAERQMRRDIRKAQEEFTLLDDGWRHAVVRWRVTAAALFLSSHKLPLREVPKTAGYASLTAMAQAFRDAGLPSPSEVRRMLSTSAGAPAPKSDPAEDGVSDEELAEENELPKATPSEDQSG